MKRVARPRATRFLTLALAGAAACTSPPPTPSNAAGPSGPGAAHRRPNVVFFLTDDQRADAMSCAGHPFLKTPNLDRLAVEGARFRNAYVTTALCAPGRASFLTGLYAHAHGVRFNGKDVVDPKIPMLPQLLQKAGYETAFIGKWHMPDNGRSRDFDYYFGFTGQGVYFNPKIAEGARNKIGPDETRTGHMDDILGDKAVEFIRRRHDKPFILFVWFKGVHRRWDPPDRYRDLYRDVEIPEPPTFRDDVAKGRPPALAEIRMQVESTPDTTPWREFVRKYLATMKGVDDNVGKILNALDETRLASDTMVIHSSDNGFFLGEHHLFDKRLMYEESVRVPLLVRWPGRAPAGRVVEAPALGVDVLPTLLEAAGVSPPAGIHGRSLLPVLKGDPPADWRRRWYYEYDEYPDPEHKVRPHRGVKVEERWKYIRWITGEGGEELYDLAEDPGETRNFAGDPAHAALLERMRREFESAKAEVGDVY